MRVIKKTVVIALLLGVLVTVASGAVSAREETYNGTDVIIEETNTSLSKPGDLFSTRLANGGHTPHNDDAFNRLYHTVEVKTKYNTTDVTQNVTIKIDGTNLENITKWSFTDDPYYSERRDITQYIYDYQHNKTSYQVTIYDRYIIENSADNTVTVDIYQDGRLVHTSNVTAVQYSLNKTTYNNEKIKISINGTTHNYSTSDLKTDGGELVFTIDTDEYSKNQFQRAVLYFDNTQSTQITDSNYVDQNINYYLNVNTSKNASYNVTAADLTTDASESGLTIADGSVGQVAQNDTWYLPRFVDAVKMQGFNDADLSNKTVFLYKSADYGVSDSGSTNDDDEFFVGGGGGGDSDVDSQPIVLLLIVVVAVALIAREAA